MLNAQVIVVGGGPAGSATAWHLASKGVDVLLLDRAVFPRSKPCAEYISPEAARILSTMRALEEIDRADSTALTGMTVIAPSGARIHGEFAARHGFRGFRDRGIGCRREILDTILLQRAREVGVRVMEGVKVEELVFSGERVCGVRARTADGNAVELHTHLVVAADGLRSTIARRLSLAHQSHWPRRLAIMSHFANVDGMSLHGEMHVCQTGYFGLAQVGANVTNVALVLPARTVAALRHAGQSPEQMLMDWIHESDDLRSRFHSAERVAPVRVTGPFASHARRAWAPGAVLVGDAADFFDPFTGEGIYAALRGGELAAPFVQRAVACLEHNDERSANKALASYDRARRDTFGGKWRVEKLIGSAVSMPWLMNYAARILSNDRDLADLLVGVTGDFVPPSALLRPRTLLRLFANRRSARVPLSA